MPNTPPNPAGGSPVGNVIGVAAQVAQGVPVSKALVNTLKDSAVVSLLGPTALFAGALVGALKSMKAVVEQSGILERGLTRIASIQQIQGKFEVLLKSATLAQARIQELYKFVASSPFGFNDVAEGARLLEALSKGALSGAAGMKLVGDAAAATGQSFSDTSERVGKLYAALYSGRSLDRIIVQMQQTGMVTDELAAKLEAADAAGTSMSGMWQIIQASLQSSAGGMAAENRSLDALTTRLGEAGKAMEAAFSTPFVDAQARALETTLKATQNLTPVLAQIGQDLAPLYTFFGNIKNQIELSTIATKGFAEALKLAWTAGEALFVGMSLATIGKFVTSIKAASSSAIDFVGSLSEAAGKAKFLEGGLQSLANAKILGIQADAAFKDGSVVTGVALKAQSIVSNLAAKAMFSHGAAMTMATKESGKFSIGAYLASIGTGGLTKVLKLGLTAISAFARGFATLTMGLLTNPFTATLLAVGATYALFMKWADSVSAVDEAYNGLVYRMSAVNAKLNAQIAAIRTLDDWRQAVANVGQELGKVNEELRGEQDTEKRAVLLQEQGSLTGKLNRLGKSTGVGLSRAEVERVTADVAQTRQTDETKTQISESLADDKRRAELLRGVAADRGREATIGDNVGRSKAAFDRSAQGQAAAINDSFILAHGDTKGRQLNANAALSALKESFGPAQANNDEKRKMLAGAQKVADNAKADALDTASREADNARLRSQSTSELVRLQQEIYDIQLKGGTASEAQIRRQAELNLLSQQYGDNQRKALDATAEASRLERGVALKEKELGYDVQIAAIRASGGETATAEMEKQVGLLEMQLSQAEALGNKLEAAQLKSQIAAVKAEQAHFRGEKGVDRAVNQAELERNPLKAQALRDAEERNKLRDQYKANGLSADQADSDFGLALKAQAAQASPTGAVSSLQSIGGGGGVEASNPMLAAQSRIERINEAQKELLTIIARNTGNSGALKP